MSFSFLFFFCPAEMTANIVCLGREHVQGNFTGIKNGDWSHFIVYCREALRGRSWGQLL